MLAAMLFSTSFVLCEDTSQKEDVFKYKKNVAIAAYSVLAAYSLKQVANSLLTSIEFMLFYRRKEEFFDESNLARALLMGGHLCNIARLSLYSYLTIFSIKNIIQELRDNGQNKKEKNKKITTKNSGSIENTAAI